MDAGLLRRRSQRILASYRHWTGQSLLATEAENLDPAEALFSAPRVVLCALGSPQGHIINYANAAALTLWETTWEELIGLPSSLTAEPEHRVARADFLDRVAREGHIRDYSGIRISRRGRRFRILEATVFNLLEDEIEGPGQAATFTQWDPV